MSNSVEPLLPQLPSPVLPEPIDVVEQLCPVVGIGASAGGLEALTALFHSLSPTTGMAYVLVQHLHPNHESVLAELLSRHTSMSVTQAVEAVTVEANHIYVIPPNSQMEIRGSVLHLTPRAEERSRYLPIDHFLCSLAQDRQGKAIGIILSGSASDGTLGLKAIKSAGGITFAQDESARFASMPQNAILAGVADFVLPPQRIARELESLALHSWLIHGKSETNGHEESSLQRLLVLVRERMGIDFLHYKRPTILRRLGRRMALHHTENIDKYLELVTDNDDELRALLDDLLINVTEFFRDPAAFDCLATTLAPQLKDRRPNQPVRVWVTACSTGEEVYSIAICIAELFAGNKQPPHVQIFGTDLSEHTIERARAGKYPASISSVVSPERLQRFFMKLESGGYQICRELREQCVFSRHDLAKDPPLGRMDLISCRNLLIYLDPVLQRRVLSTLHYALQPSGCLFLGNSESLGAMEEYFVAKDREHKLYCRNLRSQPPHFDFAPQIPGVVPLIQTPSAPDDFNTLIEQEADRVLAAEYAPSGFLVNASLQIVKFRGNTASYIAPGARSESFDVLRLVREEFVEPLSSALEEAHYTGVPSRRESIRLPGSGGYSEVDLIVRPVSRRETMRHYLILFQKKEQPVGAQGLLDAEDERDVAAQLASTRTYLQSIIEELRTANEEAQSGNEELQSTNEELQTAKEELQSSNEELTTINEEMVSRNGELSVLNNDLLNLLSSIEIPIVMLNRDLRIRRYTPTSEKVLNLIPSDVGRPISDLKPRIDVPDLEKILAGVIAATTPFEREVQDRNGRWYSLRINPYLTAESRTEGAVLQLLDIDELKRTIEAVEISRDYSDAIIGTVREPLLVLDRELRIKTASRSFLDMFRVTERETVGCLIFELGKGQWDFPKVRELLETVLNIPNGMVQDVEIEHEFAGLGWRTFQLNAGRVKQLGEQDLILLALEDITDRKRAAEAKYRRLFETAKDGIVMVDALSGEITDSNPYVKELFGYSREELLGRQFWQVEPLADVEGSQRALTRVRTEKVVRFPDVALRAKDGRTVETEIIGNVYDEGGKCVIQFNIRDITARKTFDRQLQQTARLESLGVLAGGVAHDFNNLLTGIMGNASLAIELGEQNRENRNYLKEIVRATHRASDLTRQLLAYSGYGKFIVEPLDFSALVREIVALVKTSVPKQAELQLDLKSGLPPVEADAGQMQMLIMNLVINAGEAIGEGRRGKVRVATGTREVDEEYLRTKFAGWDIRPGTVVSLEVSDTGSGMNEATQARIFDPFFTTKFTGRGLGLAAALGIIKGHRGGVHVTSSPGNGTTFEVLFPAAAKVDPPAIEESKAEDLRGSGLILLVDDEEAILDLAKSALEAYGYRVLTATSGMEAVKTVRNRGSDLNLVMLDLTMPDMGGEETALGIKEVRPDLPVLFSSGYDQTHVADTVKGPNGTRFIQKPYTVPGLLAAVKAALQN